MNQREENEQPASAASSEAPLSPEAPRLPRAPRRRPRPLFIWAGVSAAILVVALGTATVLLNHSARPVIPSAPLSIYLSLPGANLSAFDASDGHLRWRYENADITEAPMLADNVLYLASDGKVTAIKAADGSILWTYQIAGNTPGIAQIQQITDGVVYVGYVAQDGLHQQVYALDALTGALRWHFDDGAFVGGVVNGIVYVYPTHLRESRFPPMYALNASDGSVRWQFQMPYTEERILRVADGQVYVLGDSGPGNGSGLSVLNASDGSVRWTFTQTASGNIGDVEVEHGLAYVVWSESGTVLLTALDETTGATRWQQTLGQEGNPFAPLFLSNGAIYAMEGPDGLAAFNEADGRLLWHALQGQVTIFAIADGVVYLSMETHRPNIPSVVMALNASDGSIRWQGDLYAISGTLNGGVLYCLLNPYAGPGDNNPPGQHSLLFALNASNGVVRWSEETVPFTSPPVVG